MHVSNGLTPDTLIRIADGTRTRADLLKVGDSVMTHQGRARKVISAVTLNYSGDRFRIELAKSFFEVGPSCPVLAIVRGEAEPRWLRAANLRPGHIICAGLDKQIGKGFVLNDYASEVTAVHVDRVKNARLYAFDVEEDHTCLVGRAGAFIHN